MHLKPETIEKLYLSIGEMAIKIGLEPHTIRFWGKELEINIKRAGDKRRFSVKDVETFRRVSELHNTGLYTVKGIKWKLQKEKEYAMWFKKEHSEKITSP